MTRRKTQRNIFIALAIISVILVSYGLTTSLSLLTIESLPREKYIEAPTFSYLSCEPSQGGKINSSFTFDNKVKTVRCSDSLGMNDGCTIRLIPPSNTAFLRREYGYSKNGVSYIYLEGGIGGYSGEQDAIDIDLTRTDFVNLGYGQVTTGNLLDEGQSYQITGNSFSLYDHNDLSSSVGQQLLNSRTGNCFLEDDFYKGRQITYHSPEIQELKDQALDFSSLNLPYGKYTYFKSFSPLPLFSQQIEQLNGKDIYCLDNALYNILQINVGEFSYNVVNYEKGGFIKSVICCNGDEKPAYICKNHEWIKQEEAECNLNKGIFCPQSTFQPYSQKQYKRFNCEDNKCVKEVIEVKCNSDSDCTNGLVCSRQNNPLDNECVKRGEGTTIPSTTTDEETNIFIPLLIAGIGIIIAVSLIMWRMRKK